MDVVYPKEDTYLLGHQSEAKQSGRAWGSRVVQEDERGPSSLSVRLDSQQGSSESIRGAQRLEDSPPPVQKQAKKVNWFIFTVLLVLTLPLLGAGGWAYLAYKKCSSADDQNQQVSRSAATHLSGMPSDILSENALLESYSGNYTHTFTVGEDEGTSLSSEGTPLIVYEMSLHSREVKGAVLTRECGKTLERALPNRPFAYPLFYLGQEVKRDEFIPIFKGWADDYLVDEPSYAQPAAIAQIYLSSNFLSPYLSKDETDIVVSTGVMAFDEPGTHQVELFPRKNMKGTFGYIYTIESTRTVNMTSMTDGEVKGRYQVTETIEIAQQHSPFGPTDAPCRVTVHRQVKPA